MAYHSRHLLAHTYTIYEALILIVHIIKSTEKEMVLGTKVLGTQDRDEIQSWLYLFLELMMIQSYSKLVFLSKKLRV